VYSERFRRPSHEQIVCPHVRGCAVIDGTAATGRRRPVDTIRDSLNFISLFPLPFARAGYRLEVHLVVITFVLDSLAQIVKFMTAFTVTS
jgi:hypothetical protein